MTEPIIGIDLGTTNSLVSVFENGEARLIPNALGDVLTPSVVGLTDEGELLVGKAAKERLSTHPDLTTARFKRLMGTSRKLKLGKLEMSPEEVSSFILKSLKEDAEADLGHPVKDAVISVPAYFNDPQRKATVNAAKLAGLEVKRLINEPTAAAIAYGLHDKENECTFLVIDLGGGTFDVSILELFSGVMEVRASAGDAFLGGEDYTNQIAKQLADTMGLDAEALSKEDRARIRRLADRIKIDLTQSDHTEHVFEIDGTEHTLTLDRAQFELSTSELTKRLRNPVQRAISDAGLKSDKIHRIILVGGATRMPVVRNLVTKLFKRFPEHSLDPDHVVALGAAVQAGLIARDQALDDVVMTDVSAFTLGFETSVRLSENHYEGGHFSPLIERNTTIPASRSDTIHPLQKGQSEILLQIYQGEAPFVRDNVHIGSVSVPIPKNTQDYEYVDLRFTYDTSGLLEVEAKVLSTNKVTSAVFTGSSSSMDDEAIKKRLKELAHLKIHPRDELQNTELMNRLSALYQNSLTSRRDHIMSIIQRFEAALHSQDKRLIDEERRAIITHIKSLEDDNVFT